MKKWLIPVILLSVSGAALVLFPSMSDHWNRRNQTTVISEYHAAVDQTEEAALRVLLAAAEDYNRQLRALPFPLSDYRELDGYDGLLDLNNDGVMGYLVIDKLDLKLPIYHGTSEDVLNAGCGHLQGSSLPIGGEGTHVVLSAHSGLPTAKLFTELYKLRVGDEFSVFVLNRKLSYVVDRILTVTPEETREIAIIKGEDCCTLSTCTPYGINTHRYLVRGRRVG